MTILVLGCENAGKTLLINRLKELSSKYISMDYYKLKQSKILKININKLKDYKFQYNTTNTTGYEHCQLYKSDIFIKCVEIGGIMSHKWLKYIENNITTLKYILYLIDISDIIHISQSIYNLLQIISFIQQQQKDSNISIIIVLNKSDLQDQISSIIDHESYQMITFLNDIINNTSNTIIIQDINSINNDNLMIQKLYNMIHK